MPAGRPTKLTKALITKAKEYIQDYADHDHVIPSVVGMAVVLNVAKSSLYLWASEKGSEFSDIVSECNDSQELAVVLNVAKSSLYLWASEKGSEFSDIVSECNDSQEFELCNKGLKGEINSNITKLILGKHGYSDKQEVAGVDGKDLIPTIVVKSVKP